MPAFAALSALVLAADPCATVERAAPDPALAAVYAQVAREEAGRGAREAAVVAWLRAAEHEAPNGEADVALAQLCAEGREAALTARLRLEPATPRAPRAETNGRLAFELAAEAGYDSNATLVPLTTGFAHDGFAAGTALVALRPFGADGPFLITGGGYRKQLVFPQSDVGLATGTLGWDQRLGPVRATLDGGLDYVVLGGLPWLLRPRASASVLARFGQGFAGATYTLGHEALWATAARSDTGLRHWGEAEAGVAVGAHVLAVAVVAQRTSASVPERSSTEAGAELRETARSPDGKKVFEVALGARWRGFDAVDVDLQALRQEAQLDLRMLFELALDPSLAGFVALDSRMVFSSVAELTYARTTASAGLRLKVDLW